MTDERPLGRGLGSLIPKKSNGPAPIPRREPVPAVPPAIQPPPPPVPRPIPPPEVPATPAPEPGSRRLFDIPINLIDPNPHQPRHNAQGQSLDELIDSIREHGILQPLIVTKHGQRYQLIAGERRFRAAQRLHLATVPAIVREARELQQLEIAIVENVQRQDLNPIEEALAYQQLGDEFGLTQEEVARKVGKSRTAVANMVRLLGLPADMQQALRHGQITASHAKILLQAVTPNERQQLFEQILNEGLPVRAAASLSRQTTVRRHSRRKIDPATQAEEDELRSKYGTKVTISKRDHRGNISIEFYSDEEYRQLLNRLR